MERLDNALEIFNEASIFVISLHLFLCNDNLEDVGARYKLGWSIILCVLINILVNNIVLIAQTVQSVRLGIKWIAAKLRERKNKRLLFYMSNRAPSETPGRLSQWRMFDVSNTIFEDPSGEISQDFEMQAQLPKSHSTISGLYGKF
mmetsp:Transcript_23673/g.18105  ORF Transcript_23673/g.18105 Transcript_23673/m.18105 type:complete len:146 (-) Transcript_23673:350-787(-)